MVTRTTKGGVERMVTLGRRARAEWGIPLGMKIVKKVAGEVEAERF